MGRSVFTGIFLPSGSGKDANRSPGRRERNHPPPEILVSSCFGHDLFRPGGSVTGVQLVTALSAIANGGFLMKPYVVEKITNEKGEVVQSFKPETVRKVISEETARK